MYNWICRQSMRTGRKETVVIGNRNHVDKNGVRDERT